MCTYTVTYSHRTHWPQEFTKTDCAGSCRGRGCVVGEGREENESWGTRDSWTSQAGHGNPAGRGWGPSFCVTVLCPSEGPCACLLSQGLTLARFLGRNQFQIEICFGDFFPLSKNSFLSVTEAFFWMICFWYWNSKGRESNWAMPHLSSTVRQGMRYFYTKGALSESS